MQILHIVSFWCLYAAARELLLNSFDELAKKHLGNHISYFCVLGEPFEIWHWKFTTSFSQFIDNLEWISKILLTLPWNIRFFKVARYRHFLFWKKLHLYAKRHFLKTFVLDKKRQKKRIVRRRWFTIFDDVIKDFYIQARAIIIRKISSKI